MKELVAVLYGSPIGVLQQDDSGKRTFQYLPDSPRELEVSLALPYRQDAYPKAKTDAFIEGLIPEGEGVRQAFADDFGISPRNPFALLEHIGLDCAGAIQFVRPEELEAVLQRPGELVPYSDERIGQRIRSLVAEPKGSWIVNRERWSLGGAQSKFAMRWENGWHEATGAEPTTHIFKPGIHDFADQALNEHLSLRTLGVVGLNVASTEYLEFDGASAIVVRRYDRVPYDGQVVRLHQEDFCQATSTLPARKYESNKGPSALKIIRTLRDARAPEEEVMKFVEGLIGNYLLGAPDAHAKNYSIMLMPSGEVTLAPFYDIASGLPYEHRTDDGFPAKNDGLRKAAMAISGERRFGKVEYRHWEKFANDAKLDLVWLTEIVRFMGKAIPEALVQVLDEEEVAVKGSDLPSRLLAPVTDLCQVTLTQLER